MAGRSDSSRGVGCVFPAQQLKREQSLASCISRADASCHGISNTWFACGFPSSSLTWPASQSVSNAMCQSRPHAPQNLFRSTTVSLTQPTRRETGFSCAGALCWRRPSSHGSKSTIIRSCSNWHGVRLASPASPATLSRRISLPGRLVRVLPGYKCVYPDGELPGLWVLYPNRRVLHRTRLLIDFPHNQPAGRTLESDPFRLNRIRL
jgi:hypothetical protein